MTQIINLVRLATGIRDDLIAIEDNNADSLSHAIAAGEKLNEAKRLLKHGEWLPWLEDNFTLSQQTASEYMRLANYGSARNFTSIREALAAIPAEQQRKRTHGKRQKDTEGHKLWENEDVLEWVNKRMDAGVKRDDIYAESRAEEHEWPIPGSHLGQNATDRAIAILHDRKRRSGEEELKPKVKPKWSGKRLRELHAERRAGNTSDLNKLQLEIAKAVSILETFELPDLDWDEGMNTEIASFIFEDLTELEKWVANAMSTAASHMDDLDRQRLIKKLTALAEDPAAQPGERANALAAKERLIQKRRLSA